MECYIVPSLIVTWVVKLDKIQLAETRALPRLDVKYTFLPNIFYC